jgi:hypothetical protein
MRKWYYFYTPDYGFWHRHLQSQLKDHFSLNPIVIDQNSLPINESKGHHFKGNPRKIELLIQCIEKNTGNSILFSDCTLFINNKCVEEFKKYIERISDNLDVVFANNVIDKSVNIGLILIQCNQRTLQFWKLVLENFREYSWDQRLVNRALGIEGFPRLLNHPGITWGTFEKSRIVCGYRFDERYRDKFYVYKQFIKTGTKSSNWNQRLKSLNEFGFLSDNDLKTNLVEEIT